MKILSKRKLIWWIYESVRKSNSYWPFIHTLYKISVINGDLTINSKPYHGAKIMQKLSFCLSLHIFVIVSCTAFALDAYPLQKFGSCPIGYHQSSSYCVPNNSISNFATPKIGSCPVGYHRSGDYCLSNNNNANRAIPKIGSCPIGYHQSGNYCLEN